MGNPETVEIMEKLERIDQRLGGMEQELKDVKQELEKVKQELGEVKQELGDKIERLERQVELQDLSFRALVKAAKAAQEVEEELEGAYVRSGRGFNTKHIRYVRDPLG